MRDNEKTALTVGRESGATRQAEKCDAAITPVGNNSTSGGANNQAPSGCLIDFLRVGRDNAITAGKLAELSGCSPRDVSRSIEALRRRGVPICASCNEPRGYFLAADTQELQQYISALDGRIKEVRTTRAAVMEALERMNGQMIWGEGFYRAF